MTRTLHGEHQVEGPSHLKNRAKPLTRFAVIRHLHGRQDVQATHSYVHVSELPAQRNSFLRSRHPKFALVDFRVDTLLLVHYAGDGDRRPFWLGRRRKSIKLLSLESTAQRSRLEPVPEHADRSLRPRRGRCDQRVSLGSSSKPAIGDLVWACCPNQLKNRQFSFQNVVQGKGHRDPISDEDHITKGGDGAAKFESVAIGIRRHLVQPCLWKPPWKVTSHGSCLLRHGVGTTTLDVFQTAGARTASYLRSLR